MTYATGVTHLVVVVGNSRATVRAANIAEVYGTLASDTLVCQANSGMPAVQSVWYQGSAES